MARTFSKEDARLIAEAAATCADKACAWKVRALAAEEALSKFAAEVYGSKLPAALSGNQESKA